MNSLSNARQKVVELQYSQWPEGVTSAVLKAAGALGKAERPSAVAIVVPHPPADAAHRACLREALRGLIHSSVLEAPEIRANLVYGGSDGDRNHMIAYLADATFVFGATIDLGQTA